MLPPCPPHLPSTTPPSLVTSLVMLNWTDSCTTRRSR
ncbi:hypothetical protein E2C01_095977 [Portunus trituberculatus]|uniref:Uncharacterized protein n=1 Tax=Portunus trituberculatus TaxID=210409 RepID=A0A5B7JRF2_PORTR|nr:hypothetical protein [Portunus trituberculatus]